MALPKTQDKKEKAGDVEALQKELQFSKKLNFITNKINGVLKALIVETDTNIQIRIALSEHDSIVLFEDVSFYGTQYLPISAEKILKRNEKLLYSSTDWILNDKLRIVVKGPFNSTVKIKVRYM